MRPSTDPFMMSDCSLALADLAKSSKNTSVRSFSSVSSDASGAADVADDVDITDEPCPQSRGLEPKTLELPASTAARANGEQGDQGELGAFMNSDPVSNLGNQTATSAASSPHDVCDALQDQSRPLSTSDWRSSNDVTMPHDQQHARTQQAPIQPPAHASPAHASPAHGSTHQLNAHAPEWAPVGRAPGQASPHSEPSSSPTRDILTGWSGRMATGFGAGWGGAPAAPTAVPSLPTSHMQSTLRNDAIVELRGSDGLVTRVLSAGAFGYHARELINQPFLAIALPDERHNMVHAFQVLLRMDEIARLMNPARGAGGASPPNGPPPQHQAIRVRHHVLARLHGQGQQPVAVDSVIALAPTSGAGDGRFVIRARATAPEDDGPFSMAPVQF